MKKIEKPTVYVNAVPWMEYARYLESSRPLSRVRVLEKQRETLEARIDTITREIRAVIEEAKKTRTVKQDALNKILEEHGGWKQT